MTKHPAELKDITWQTIECPYCDHSFAIDCPTSDPTAPHEIWALPYARDVKIFDPLPDEDKSQWTEIGKDFFGSINYEKFFGILHMEEGWRVRYRVVRCPDCRMLMDIFLNLTSQRRLSDMWPHLLSESPDGRIQPAPPSSMLNKLFGNTFFMGMFLILLYVVSFVSQIRSYSQELTFDSHRFLVETLPLILVRGIAVICLLILLSVRGSLIALFRDRQALSELFHIKDEVIGYWSNFAVSRFTGYQNEERFFTPNSVMLLGGVLSCVILGVTGVIVRFGAPVATPSPGVVAGVMEVVFWLIIAFAFGIVVWNLTVVPMYILSLMEEVPMRVDFRGRIEGVKVIRQIHRYSNAGIFVLIATVLALSILPMYVAGVAEIRWIIIWTQSALVVCFTILGIRFEIRCRDDQVERVMGATKWMVIFVLYVLVRWGVGVSQTNGWIVGLINWLGIGDARAVREHAELAVFSIMAAYLFIKLSYGRLLVIKGLRENAKKKKLPS
jgi:hypothetical protein